jgi:hypothetical protein
MAAIVPTIAAKAPKATAALALLWRRVAADASVAVTPILASARLAATAAAIARLEMRRMIVSSFAVHHGLALNLGANRGKIRCFDHDVFVRKQRSKNRRQ